MDANEYDALGRVSVVPYRLTSLRILPVIIPFWQQLNKSLHMKLHHSTGRDAEEAVERFGQTLYLIVDALKGTRIPEKLLNNQRVPSIFFELLSSGTQLMCSGCWTKSRMMRFAIWPAGTWSELNIMSEHVVNVVGTVARKKWHQLECVGCQTNGVLLEFEHILA